MKSLLASLLLLVWATPSLGLPVVVVDMDPSTPGIQDTLAAALGITVAVDVVVLGVEAGAPLNAFEFDLDFSSAILTPVSVVGGGFLLDPTVVAQLVLGAVSVEFAEATVGSGSVTGDGVLATVTFDTVGLGTSPLDLNDVILSAPFGVPIATAGVTDGEIVVPEPSTLVLVGVGLTAAVATRRRARGQEATLNSA